MSSLIKYFKKLFLKKEPSVNNKINVTNNYLESISELNLSDGEKIELLVIKVLGITAEEISDNSDLRIDFGADDLDIIELFIEIENLFKIKIQEGAFRLTIEELKKYVEKKINNPDYFIPEDQIFKEETFLYGLAKILHHESNYGCSLAIKELVENKYIILQEESGNPYKELINFTLLYFTSGKFTDNEILIKTIQKYFPIMGNYLIRQLNIIDPSIQFHSDFNDLTIDNLDEKKAYDEFLNFAYILFVNKYPNKELRDNAIRNNFKSLASGLMLFIDEKLKNEVGDI
jgi:acyl carrier protein